MSAISTAPPPGIYRDTPMPEYHAWDAVSNSRLSRIMRSPAHLQAYLAEPYDDTAALAFGRAAHTAILEPDEFQSRYVVASQCVAVTAKGEQCKKTGTIALADPRATVCSTHKAQGVIDKDVEVLSPADHRHCLGMWRAVHATETAHGLLEGLTDVEVSVRWDEIETGLPCKARWDGRSEVAGGCIIDLKSTRDASPSQFERAIFDYGYHRQGAFYLASADAHDIPAKHYVIIAIEKVPPYGVGVYRLTEAAIQAGEEQVFPLMQRYAECAKSGHWPCYPDEVRDIGLPDWAWNQLSNQVEGSL